MATAILHWKVQFENGKENQEGYCLETYTILDGKIRVVQDATV